MIPDTLPLNKQQLRQNLLQQRLSLSLERWQTQSLRLSQQLLTCPLYQQATTVLAYLSVRQEPDLSHLFQGDKQWGLPRCVKKDLIWHYWQTNEPLNRGKYGILEPYPDSPLIDPQNVDLILVPAIACDHQGYRLGYGGGFYDRLFSSPQWENVPSLGIIFDFAYLERLPRDSWDKPLIGVCTETGWQLLTPSK